MTILNRRTKLIVKCCGVVLALGVVGFGVLYGVHGYIGKDNAKKLVFDLYSFNDIKDVKGRQDEIKKLVTKDTYPFVSFDNMEHSLSAYLKAKGNPCKVMFESITDDYIIYSLDCKSITPGRTFMLMYDSNIFGKIRKVREAEVVDFY